MKTSKYFLLCVFIMVINDAFFQPVYAQATDRSLTDSLLQELSNIKTDTGKIKILCRLATAFAPNDRTKALNYANQCMNISKQVKWIKGIGLAYYALAETYYQLSYYSTSLQNGQKAYDIFKSIDHKNNMGSSCLMVAKNYREMGYYTKAIENDLAALKLFETINDRHGIKTCYTNLGNNYYYISDYDKAIENYNKALGGSRELNDEYGIALELDNISSVFIEKGVYDSADMYNLQAIKVFEEINDQPELSRAYFNRGNILKKLYNAASAYEYYMRAVEIDKRLGIKIELLHAYGGIGELYLAVAKDTAGKYIIPPLFKTDKRSLLKKAQYYLKKALSQESISDIYLLMYYSNIASEAEERLGNYKDALTFRKEHSLYKDSIFNDENKKKIAALENERLAEIKDKEIQLLNKDKALQASAIKRQTITRNAILGVVSLAAIFTFFFIRSYNRRRKAMFSKEMQQTEMKALRAQMNPHFIFNSLHSINRYVLENDKDNASAYLSKFAKLMRLVLENSREQEVPLENDLAALELYMQLEALRFQNRFRYSIEIDPAIDTENTLIPPLMLQPFAENAIVHGLKDTEGGLIRINIRAENSDMIKCIVEDNGTGRDMLPEQEQQENKKRKSLGMKIVQERLNIINQLKKAKAAVHIFDIKDAENKPGGLRIELLLPLRLAF